MLLNFNAFIHADEVTENAVEPIKLSDCVCPDDTRINDELVDDVESEENNA